jgi:hypothetical protein
MAGIATLTARREREQEKNENMLSDVQKAPSLPIIDIPRQSKAVKSCWAGTNNNL